jgi:hypothetical protein
MTTLDPPERRRETRNQGDYLVSVTARDKEGELFTQDAMATRTSMSGALLIGISRNMRQGDVISVQCSGRQVRFKVVWVRNSEATGLAQVAVQRCGPEDVPWLSK